MAAANRLCWVSIALLTGCMHMPAARQDDVRELPASLREIVAATQSATVDEIARLLGQEKSGDFIDHGRFVTQDGYHVSNIITHSVEGDRLSMSFSVAQQPCFSVKKLVEIANAREAPMYDGEGRMFAIDSSTIGGTFFASWAGCLTGIAFGR